MNFTPGKWKQIRTEVTAGDRLIANTGGHSTNYKETRAENIANAQLIAAAPEMYEALKAVTGYLSEQIGRRAKKSFADQRAGSDAADLLPIIEKAIANAEGK